MTYPLRETATSVDHDNFAIVIEGAEDSFSVEEYAGIIQQDAAPMLKKFGVLWDGVVENLQSPIMNDELQLKGFTGHRIVTFHGRMGRSALGFQVMRNGSDTYRSITAYRRKVYADNRRRLNYTADELSVSANDIINNPFSPQMEYRLGILGVWLDKFNAA